MISFDGDSTIKQPQGLNEYDIPIQYDNTSIDGSVQRNRLGTKKGAQLTFELCTPTEYQALLDFFQSGDAIAYSNDSSNRSGGTFAFTGLVSYEEANYTRGGTLLKTIVATFRET